MTSISADIIFDRIQSPMAVALADRVSAWAIVHEGLDADAIDGRFENAAGRVIVVFDVPSMDERPIAEAPTGQSGQQTGDVIQQLRAELNSFLTRCQAVVKSGSLKSEPIQVWSLSQDDIACRQLGLPETPIQTQSRLSCFKSLAKEYGRMGIYFNTCIFQPEKSLLSKENLKNLKHSMKPYALRYKAPDADDLGAVLESVMLLDNPVMNGGALNLGNGPLEFGS